MESGIFIPYGSINRVMTWLFRFLMSRLLFNPTSLGRYLERHRLRVAWVRLPLKAFYNIMLEKKLRSNSLNSSKDWQNWVQYWWCQERCLTKNRPYLKQGFGDIYVLQSPSGKHYIGQAKHCLIKGIPWGSEERWVSHISDANKQDGGTCRKLNYAIRKYGPEHFTLLVCRLEYLDYYEQMFIAEYDAVGSNGYNLRKGGNKSELSDETRYLNPNVTCKVGW